MLVALPLLGSAILLISCGSNKETGASGQENILTMRSDTLTQIESENGKINSRFYAPRMEEYKYATEPYMEFPLGIDIITYDSIGDVKSTLVANYAIFWMNLNLWEAKGDVKATNHEGHALESSQLYWNRKTKRIYSNVDTRLTRGGDVVVGTGFESDENMYKWNYRRPHGELMIEVEPNRNDSTNVTSPPAGNPPIQETASVPKSAGIPVEIADESERGAERETRGDINQNED